MRAYLSCWAVLLGVAMFGCVGCGDDTSEPGGTAGTGVAGVTAGVVAGEGAAGTSGAGAGAAGTGAGSGAGTGAAGGGAGTGAVMSEREACLIYIKATCQRRNECAGIREVDNPCSDQQAACPDLLFSPGSARTIEGTLACANEFKVFPCADVNANKVPPCVIAGTRKPNEACLYPNQCESLFCTRPGPDPAHPDCGTCARTWVSGDDCSAPGITCPVNQRCQAGVCTTFTSLPVTPVERLALGSTCTGNECVEGTVCLVEPTVTSGSPSTCQVMPGIGAVCGRSPGTTSDSPFGRQCVDGAYCDTSNHCVQVPAVGEPCGTVFGGPLPGAPVACDLDVAGCISGVCVAHGTQGEACGSAAAAAMRSGSCVSDTDCIGTAAECGVLVCDATNVCARTVAEGQACDAPATTCEQGTACESGVCVSQGLQGLFEMECGP